MEAILALRNAVFLAFIVSTMLSVGLATTITQLTGVLRDSGWLLGALAASLVASWFGKRSAPVGEEPAPA